MIGSIGSATPETRVAAPPGSGSPPGRAEVPSESLETLRWNSCLK
jgi:hypothetical protein